MKSQDDRILAWLKAGRTLTPLEALHKFGSLRLGARIWDLRRCGYQIESVLVRKGSARVARYRLVA